MRKRGLPSNCLWLSCQQDLECDVSVEDDNRQEWVFTLYDFDNSGKVTKEVQARKAQLVW